MKFILVLLLFTSAVFAKSDQDDKKVSDLTVQELTETVRSIVQESIEKCVVAGTMEGRAKVNLAVVGSVVAQMSCNFDEVTDNSETSEIN